MTLEQNEKRIHHQIQEKVSASQAETIQMLQENQRKQEEQSKAQGQQLERENTMLSNQAEKRPASANPATPPPRTKFRTADPTTIDIDTLAIYHLPSASTSEQFRHMLSTMKPDAIQYLYKAMIEHDPDSAMEMDDSKGEAT